MKKTITFSIGFLLSGIALMAQNPLTPAKGFNVMVKNNLTISSNETDGPMAVGGNLTIKGNYQVNIHSVGTYTGVEGKLIGLYVGGKVDYNAGNTVKVDNSRYVKIGDLSTSTVNNGNQGTETTRIVKKTLVTDINTIRNQNPRIELSTTQPVESVQIQKSEKLDMESIFSQLQDNSTLIANCQSSVDLYDTDKASNANKGKITANEIPSSGRVEVKLTRDKVNFLDLTGEQLNKISTLVFKDNIQPNSTTPFVINITEGTTINWNSIDISGIGDQQGQYILFNFPNTTTLTLKSRNNTIRGTILAPNADFEKTISSNIDGQVVALSYNQSGGENHYQVFSADVSGCQTNNKSLPVELATFKAQATDQQQTKLTWSTAQESNSSYFAIERSQDGKSFETIKTVAAQGKSTATKNYSFLDTNPSFGVNYYRLKQMDTDGTIHNLRMVSIIIDSPENRLHAVYPNPNHGESFAIRVQDADTQVKMISTQGIEISVSTHQIESRTLQVTPSHRLQTGTYLLRIQDHSGVYTKKVMIL
ncbi:collagen-binding domain-containing protein [Siphonobacter sp. SORGH_AS_1065]|uniref:collagen-binding domain-containing protein n=1 Tax=Siphonobacter sp. SORGH_AS_1065 TaxID=3041795 RepID=UPI0027855930|nr:collagen-binding domain-containing protein [Siphonobacter sp. SORGH_AS_1065]MDQ1090050.1 choice-of-anchor A domain-containing protein [Siphonobacter sp. SORGH_AS_1065]